jgi:phosphoribosyl 1,2-cyclic phosphodiesterase
MRYGGHTSCLAVAHDGDDAPTLLLDCGTGLRNVTLKLRELPFAGSILLTHLHWDHILGLPFFGAAEREGARADVLLPVQDGTDDARAVLAGAMSPPYFPIGPDELGPAWSFGMLPPGEWQGEGFRVLAREVPHKGGRTFGYRVTDGSAVLAYIPDHGPTALGPGPDGHGEYHEAALELSSGADVLVHDAQLLCDADLAHEASFGHATASYAVALAQRAGVRRLLLFHHRFDRTDEELDRLARPYESESVYTAVQGTALEL